MNSERGTVGSAIEAKRGCCVVLPVFPECPSSLLKQHENVFDMFDNMYKTKQAVMSLKLGKL